MILWLSGNSGAGKTTLATFLKDGHKDVIHLDGDMERQTICSDLGLSKMDRWENNLRIARFAKLIEDSGFNVIISVICPYKELRKEVKKITGCTFLYLLERGKQGKEYPYEKPDSKWRFIINI